MEPFTREKPASSLTAEDTALLPFLPCLLQDLWKLAGGASAEVEAIRRRAGELAARHPDKKPLFESYVQSQQNEVSNIENSLVNLIWLLQRDGRFDE